MDKFESKVQVVCHLNGVWVGGGTSRAKNCPLYNTEKDLIHHSKGDELERRKNDKTDLTHHSKGDGLEKKEKDKKDL